MAWTAATAQSLVVAAREKLITAELELEQYLLVNNPGILSRANTALTAAAAAITALQA